MTEVRVGDVVGCFEINEVADYYGKIVDVNEDKVFMRMEDSIIYLQ